MSHVHPRYVTSVPWLSHFPELNVRTYVRVGDKPGVFFFSLDAGNPVAVFLARTLFYLPYFRARMDMATRPGGHTVHYQSVRTHGDAFPARFAPILECASLRTSVVLAAIRSDGPAQPVRTAAANRAALTAALP